MNLLDSAIAYFSPGWAAQRAQSRLAIAAMAQLGRDRPVNSYRDGTPTRMTESWPTSHRNVLDPASIGQELLSTAERGYHAYRSNSVARTLLNSETDNVIGDGPNFEPQSGDEAWNREALDRYYEWVESCSVRGRDIHGGAELQRMLWAHSRAAGDIGWILVSRPMTGDSLIQVVPRENICTPDHLSADSRIIDGIRYDDFGAPQSYFILRQDGLGMREWIEIPARDFVFLAHMLEPTSARGTSCYVTVFDILTNLSRYIDGVALAAWMATVFGLIIKQNNIGRDLTLMPTATNSRGETQRAFTLEGGLLKFMGTEGEVAQVQAHQPMQQTPAFIDQWLRLAGQPFDMPLEVLGKNMSQCTFASARIGLLGFYRACRIRFAHFCTAWNRTTGWWLSRERLRAPGDRKRWRTLFPPDYRNFEFRINAWDYTSPTEEAQADQIQIDMGIKSPQMVISERGRNMQKIVRERREWDEQTKDLPQTRSTLTRDAVPTPETPAADPVKAYARAFRDLLRADASDDDPPAADAVMHRQTDPARTRGEAAKPSEDDT